METNKEIWKDIPGYEGLYQVSNLGRVKSLQFNEKILKQAERSKGYYSVTLYNVTRKTFLVHRLVALAFISNPNNYDQVNHKDEDTFNNTVANLEWCDCKYNQNYGTRNSRMAKTLGKKIKCVETGIIYQSCSDAGRKLMIDPSGISKAANHKKNKIGGYHWEYADKGVS